MRIVITTQVFPPEPHPTAVMVGQLAAFLARRGHEVTVACGHPHHPTGLLPSGWRRPLLARERRDGFEVVRGWHPVSASRALPSRAAVWAAQALGTVAAASRSGPVDAVVSFGPPLVGPLLSAGLARARGARLVTVVYDIYPDVAVESGAVRNPLVIAAARAAERAAYRASDRLVVLSEGFRRTLEAKGIAPGRIAVIPVWLEADEIRPLPRDSAWRREQGIGPETLVVLYAGTIGLVSGAGVVLDAARRLQGRADVLFLFVGEGQAKDELQERARREGAANVRFLPLQPRERLAEVQAAADLSLVTLSPGRGHTSVPSKVIAYMAAGRPVVASVDQGCDTAAAVGSAGCGEVVPPGDAAALAGAVEALLADPGRRRAMGERARAAFEAGYAAGPVLERFAGLLESLGPGGAT